MIDCEIFYKALNEAGLGLYTGVPDSLLKEICACINEKSSEEEHIITANEGTAVALALGSYLATGKVGMVYMQNSGLGNAVNPLLSLADEKVYSIPLLLMIGWRGEPGVKDEPQHLKQGEVTLGMLGAMGVPYAILPDSDDQALAVLKQMLSLARDKKKPVAIVVRKDTFAKYRRKTNVPKSPEITLKREQSIKVILDEIAAEDLVVGTTGMISREIFEYREKSGQGHTRDFLTVGGMGHCSQIAMAIAASDKNKQVYCIDGDGSVIMHMGALAISGQYRGGNLIHIVLNNGRHDSVGGQPSAGLDLDIPAIAKACGYSEAMSADTEEAIRRELQRFARIKDGAEAPVLLEVRVLPGSRSDLGRPTTTPIENKEGFMNDICP